MSATKLSQRKTSLPYNFENFVISFRILYFYFRRSSNPGNGSSLSRILGRWGDWQVGVEANLHEEVPPPRPVATEAGQEIELDDEGWCNKHRDNNAWAICAIFVQFRNIFVSFYSFCEIILIIDGPPSIEDIDIKSAYAICAILCNFDPFFCNFYSSCEIILTRDGPTNIKCIEKNNAWAILCNFCAI